MILSAELVFVEIKKNININPQSSANLNRHQERNIQFFRFTFKKYVLVLYFIKKKTNILYLTLNIMKYCYILIRYKRFTFNLLYL